MALTGTEALATVFPSESLVAVAGAIDAASLVVAELWAHEFRAVRAGPGFITHTHLILAAASASAVVEALGFRAVLAEVSLRADANALLAPAV